MILSVLLQSDWPMPPFSSFIGSYCMSRLFNRDFFKNRFKTFGMYWNRKQYLKLTNLNCNLEAIMYSLTCIKRPLKGRMKNGLLIEVVS